MLATAGCRGKKTPPAGVDSAQNPPISEQDATAAPIQESALQLDDVWVGAPADERPVARFRAGEAVAIGFRVARVEAQNGMARLRIGLSLRKWQRAASATDLRPDGVETGPAIPIAEPISTEIRAKNGQSSREQTATTAVIAKLPADLQPGEYRITVEVTDLVGKKAGSFTPLVQVSAPVALVRHAESGALAAIRWENGARLSDVSNPKDSHQPLFPGEKVSLIAEMAPGLTPKSAKFSQLEWTLWAPPPNGETPTALVGAPVTSTNLWAPFSFEIPLSAHKKLLVRARAIGVRGNEIGRAEASLSVDLGDGESYLSSIQASHAALLAQTQSPLPGIARSVPRGGFVIAGETLTVRVFAGGYRVAGRRVGKKEEFAIGVQLHIRVRDRDGKLVTESHRASAIEGMISHAPPRLVLSAPLTVPNTLVGRAMIEIDVEDALSNQVSTVYREVVALPPELVSK